MRVHQHKYLGKMISSTLPRHHIGSSVAGNAT